MIDGLGQTGKRGHESGGKRLVYLYAEFLIGHALRNNLFNLGLLEEAELAIQAIGWDLSEIVDEDTDAPLGGVLHGVPFDPGAYRPMDTE